MTKKFIATQSLWYKVWQHSPVLVPQIRVSRS